MSKHHFKAAAQTKREVIRMLEADPNFTVRDTGKGWQVATTIPDFVPMVPGRYTAGTHKSDDKTPWPFLSDLKRFFGWTPPTAQR